MEEIHADDHVLPIDDSISSTIDSPLGSPLNKPFILLVIVIFDIHGGQTTV